jgi:hypothetical protein
MTTQNNEIGFFVIPRAVIGGANGVCFERNSAGSWNMTDASFQHFLNNAETDAEAVAAADEFVARFAGTLESNWQRFAADQNESIELIRRVR